MATPILQDDVIRLRAVEPDDIETLFKWENDTTIWSAGCSVAPYSKKVIWEYIENYNPDILKSNQLRLMIVLKDSGTAIGTVDLYEFDVQNRRAGAGILIDSEYRNKGFGTRCLKIISDYAGTFLGMHQIWAVVGVENASSIKLFQKCGFNICGRLRSWLRTGKSYNDAFMLQKFVD